MWQLLYSRNLWAPQIMAPKTERHQAPKKTRAAPAIGLPSPSVLRALLCLDLRQIRQGLFDILGRVEFDILELTFQEAVIGRQIKVAMA